MSDFNNEAGTRRFCGPDLLFPHDAVPEHQNIRFVTFCERRTDGYYMRLEDFDADKMRCWDDVNRALAPGLYRAVGMDDQRRPVAMYPPKDGGWVAICSGAEPCVMPDSAVVGPAPPAAASPSLDPTLRAWIEADTERIRADTERLREQTEYTRRQCAWMDMVLAMMQSPAAARPSGKPN